MTEESQEKLTAPHFKVSRAPHHLAGTGRESDNRITTVVNIQQKGISSCRSNNDVARRNFMRSPGRMNQSPLSHGVQPIFSGKSPNEDSVSKRDSSRKERYSYLRSVGNAVVNNQDVRKSVDRIRMSSELDYNIKSKSELGQVEGITQFEEAGRRSTVPEQLNQNRLAKSSLNQYHNAPAIVISAATSGINSAKNSQSELFMRNMQAENAHEPQRSSTSYAVHQVGPMMMGRPGFVKRIAPPQSKSALDKDKDDKEN